MYQPIAIEYLGAVEAKRNVEVTSASIIALYPTANVIKMKTKNIKATVNHSVLFHIDYNEENYLETGNTYSFDGDCVFVVGKYVVIS